MSNKKTRNRHKNKPTKRQMLKMHNILTDKFDLDNSEEIPHMINYYLPSLHDEITEKKRKIKQQKQNQKKNIHK